MNAGVMRQNKIKKWKKAKGNEERLCSLKPLDPCLFLRFCWQPDFLTPQPPDFPHLVDGILPSML